MNCCKEHGFHALYSSVHTACFSGTTVIILCVQWATRLLNHQSVCLCLYLCLSLSLRLSLSLSVSISALSVCLSVCLCLSVSLPLSISLSCKKRRIVTHRGCIFQFAIQFPFHIFLIKHIRLLCYCNFFFCVCVCVCGCISHYSSLVSFCHFSLERKSVSLM